MFHVIDFNKTCLYKIKYNYTVTYKYIYGNIDKSGWVDVTFLKYTSYYSNRNFRGKPLAIDINSMTNNINYRIHNGREFIFTFKLEYIMRNKGIIEIKYGEIKSQLMESGYFPLYYYLKIKNDNYINIYLNLRLNSFDDSVMKNNFDIKGYLLNEDTIEKN